MLIVEKCPICECDRLHDIKKYQFALPETKEYDDLIDDVSFRYERLWILFEKIWKDQSPAEFNVNLCDSCGLIFTNPRFTAEEITIKYKTVGELDSAKKRTEKKPALKVDERAKRIYSLLNNSQINGAKSLNILDYGGAKGYNLIPFVEAGHSCYLVDYVKYDYPEKVNYLGRDLDDLKDDQLFDVILFCHTLEHTTDPKSIVKDLTSHLTEGGCIYVEVPLGCFTEWKRLKEPLTHVNFFSEESLFKCLRSADLDIVYLSTAHQWVTQSEFWCLNIVGSKQKGNTITQFKPTWQQMKNPRLIDQPRYYLKELTRKLKRLPKKVLNIVGSNV